MKFLRMSRWSHVAARTAALASLASLLNACGGGEEEPTVAIVGEIHAAYLRQGPEASAKEEQDLRRAGLSPANKRCRLSSGKDLSGNQIVVFIEGIHPRNVICDIPFSQLEKARALGFEPYDPSQWWQGEFPWREFKCEEANL